MLSKFINLSLHWTATPTVTVRCRQVFVRCFLAHSMKPAILVFLFCIGLLHSHASDEPLIPAALNSILPKIHGGMTVPEIEVLLAPAYPKAKGQVTIWDGQTGYVDYTLDDQFSLSISSITRDGKIVVHNDLLFYLHNYAAKHRVDIKSYFYESPTQKKTKFLDH